MNELHPTGPPPPAPPSQGPAATPPPYRDPLATGGVPRSDLTVAAPAILHEPVPTQATPQVPTNGAGPARAPAAAHPTPAAAPTPAPASEAARMDALEVTSWFGTRKVLERCTLSMEPGRVTALIGPSGCGKSTFLRALNRMHELVPGAAIAGQILLNGVDIYSEEMSPTEVRLRVGMVFQKPNPFPAMSIAENVLAGLKLSGTSHPDHGELVEQSLCRAGLWEEVKDRLHEGGMSLSGGQQQRLCIARSLAVRPDVLLMDEPCSALDPISTGVIEETIRELCHDITIVIVTHNMQQAQRVSDECAFFLVESLGDSGRIVEHGPTGRMFSNPSDPRTLDYVSGRFG
jgi:phosphate transport system ATP-binding protein